VLISSYILHAYFIVYFTFTSLLQPQFLMLFHVRVSRAFNKYSVFTTQLTSEMTSDLQ